VEIALFDGEGATARKSLLDAVGRMYVAGVEIDADGLYDGRARRVPLPGYPFEHTTYRAFTPEAGAQPALAPAAKPALAPAATPALAPAATPALAPAATPALAPAPAPAPAPRAPRTPAPASDARAHTSNSGNGGNGGPRSEHQHTVGMLVAELNDWSARTYE
jgi:acyl transferase domain-containing protein